jgi:C4-dicarboxylate-specific signal transduction histidine kinase
MEDEHTRERTRHADIAERLGRRLELNDQWGLDRDAVVDAAADLPAANAALHAANAELRATVERLEGRVQQSEARRRALLHIMADLHDSNRRLAEQRKAMLHILADYERDRSRLSRQTARLDNSRRALLHILQDVHASNQRLEHSRKAMIHIMGDLRETTAAIQSRERELREKQEQLIQAGKLATLGELTTGVAHELNNPLNNIGLFVGNVIDQIELQQLEGPRMLRDLRQAMQQVRKATEIISHLRTFGRAAPVSREPVALHEVIERALALMAEQLRLRQITVVRTLRAEAAWVVGNPIQLEQVLINLLTNARDALAQAPHKVIHVETECSGSQMAVVVWDTGPGIPPGLEQRIFDPFFSTKEVGEGTGLGLSITYGILKEHQGSITVANRPGAGAAFRLELPRAVPPAGRAPSGPEAARTEPAGEPHRAEPPGEEPPRQESTR